MKFAVLSAAEARDLSGLLYDALRPAGGRTWGGKPSRPDRIRALVVLARAARRPARELVALRRAG